MAVLLALKALALDLVDGDVRSGRGTTAGKQHAVQLAFGGIEEPLNVLRLRIAHIGEDPPVPLRPLGPRDDRDRAVVTFVRIAAVGYPVEVAQVLRLDTPAEQVVDHLRRGLAAFARSVVVVGAVWASPAVQAQAHRLLHGIRRIMLGCERHAIDQLRPLVEPQVALGAVDLASPVVGDPVVEDVLVPDDDLERVEDGTVPHDVEEPVVQGAASSGGVCHQRRMDVRKDLVGARPSSDAPSLCLGHVLQAMPCGDLRAGSGIPDGLQVEPLQPINGLLVPATPAHGLARLAVDAVVPDLTGDPPDRGDADAMACSHRPKPGTHRHVRRPLCDLGRNQQAAFLLWGSRFRRLCGAFASPCKLRRRRERGEHQRVDPFALDDRELPFRRQARHIDLHGPRILLAGLYAVVLLQPDLNGPDALAQSRSQFPHADPCVIARHGWLLVLQDVPVYDGTHGYQRCFRRPYRQDVCRKLRHISGI